MIGFPLVLDQILSPLFEERNNLISFLNAAATKMDLKPYDYSGAIELILEALQDQLLRVFGEKLGLHIVKIKVTITYLLTYLHADFKLDES